MGSQEIRSRGRFCSGRQTEGKARHENSEAQWQTCPSEGLLVASLSHRVWRLPHPRKGPKRWVLTPWKLGPMSKWRLAPREGIASWPLHPGPQEGVGARGLQGGAQTSLVGTAFRVLTGSPNLPAALSLSRPLFLVARRIPRRWSLVKGRFCK